MLIEALTAHFREQFDREPICDAVLWFDPEGDYAALVDHLKSYRVWSYDGSLLKLRYELNRRADGERVVVYLPLQREEAEILRPFYATSYLFEEGLYRFLRREGFDFPDDAEVTHQLRRLLPRLAARSLGKGRAFWTHNLANLERARETLLGSFDDTLLAFLAAPRKKLSDLENEQLEGLFLAQLESTYGFGATEDAPPDELAQRFAAQLVMIRAYTDAGQPEDFPYIKALPIPAYFDRCRTFLDRWQRDTQYLRAYKVHAAALENRYDLARWTREMDLDQALTLGATLMSVETALWDVVQADLGRLEGEGAWLTWLERYRDAFAARAEKFWGSEGHAPWWGILRRAADLLMELQSTRDELDGVSTAGKALRRYAAEWWQSDHDFRVLREALDAQAQVYDTLRSQCARSYHDVLSRMNTRFTALVEGRSWPPDEGMAPQDGFWHAIEETLDRQRHVAILFVDALRYELGQALLAALVEDQAGSEREIAPRLAAIPTVTPVGMTAVLPDGDRRQVAYKDDWQLTIADSGNLKDKAARKTWLARQVDGVAFYNLDDLLDQPTDKLSGDGVIVVFDTTLDQVGEHAGRVAWNTFSTLLQSVKQGVHKLLASGVTCVHIVADHGFLLVDRLKEHEKVTVRDARVKAKGDRYVLGGYLSHTDQVSLPVDHGEGLQAWFPRGIGCFRTPGAYNFVHGGISLQELVVPHITIKRTMLGRPVGVEAKLPAEIVNATPEVVLQPVQRSVFDEPRAIVLTLERAESNEVLGELRKAVAPNKPATEMLMLPFDCELHRGERLRWVLRDAYTGEVLVSQDAVSAFEKL